ncbi:hypothetical protein [Sulfuracidifex metallicus]|uniref:hypothetical protein n=1 Tax=Sulfuracidifex metallicus TaxID=47303 RepID=UPI002275C258|nr:hypothetical protein [Sulfuracidifex metallicus]MCY0849682.1 hypothetical protein [Sulfuracidifex metallicus]
MLMKSGTFLLYTRYSRKLVLILYAGTFLAFLEPTFRLWFNSPILTYFINTTSFTKYYFMLLMVPQIFLYSPPTRSDAFIFFTLPMRRKEIRTSWALFQFLSRFGFTSFMEGTILLPMASPIYVVFSLQYSLTGSLLNATFLYGRKEKTLIYLIQLVEVFSLTLPLFSVFLSGILTALSFFIFSRYKEKEMDSVFFSLFQDNEEGGKDKIFLSGERSVIFTRMLHPLVALTFNASGQIRIIKPRFDGRAILIASSIVTGVAVFIFSHLRAHGPYGKDFIATLIPLTMYFSMLLQGQWLVVGTLAYERPWIGVQTLGEKYLFHVHIGNIVNLTLSWASLFFVVALLSPSYAGLSVLILPFSWLVYLLLFVATTSSAPNLEAVAEGSQPYQSNVKNLFGLSTLIMVPFILVNLSGLIYVNSGGFVVLLGEGLAVALTSVFLSLSGKFNTYTMKLLMEKGYV